MVLRKNLKEKFALISVFEKKNLRYLCSNLRNFNYSFISSGATGKKIRSLGFKCKDISQLTKFKEMFGGRVKTLNPLIYGSLLYIRDDKNHVRQFRLLNIPEIDIVVVNLYPFKRFLNKHNNEEAIEMIDIGGPSLLRAAGKNFKYITPIIDTMDYKKLITNINKNNGTTDIIFRKKMAHKVFKHTAQYDKIVSDWLNEK